MREERRGKGREEDEKKVATSAGSSGVSEVKIYCALHSQSLSQREERLAILLCSVQ